MCKVIQEVGWACWKYRRGVWADVYAGVHEADAGVQILFHHDDHYGDRHDHLGLCLCVWCLGKLDRWPRQIPPQHLGDQPQLELLWVHPHDDCLRHPPPQSPSDDRHPLLLCLVLWSRIRAKLGLPTTLSSRVTMTWWLPFVKFFLSRK